MSPSYYGKYNGLAHRIVMRRRIGLPAVTFVEVYVNRNMYFFFSFSDCMVFGIIRNGFLFPGPIP